MHEFQQSSWCQYGYAEKGKDPAPPKEIQDQIAAELMQRRSQANVLRRQAIKEWADAKAQFEKELLGE